MALALAASAVAASADQPDNNKNDHHTAQPPAHPGNPPPAGQPHGGPPPGAIHAATPQGPAHTGAPAGAQTFNGQAVGGNTFHGNGQAGGAGAQNYRGYGRGPGGNVTPGAPTGQATTGGQTGQFHGGNPNGAAAGNQFHAGAGAPGGQSGAQFHGGNQFHGNPAVNAAIRGGTPGANHDLRSRDAGRGWYNASRFPQRFQAQRRFHVGWVNRPHGWYQRTWAFGEFLPFGWFAPEFYLDYQDYGLAYPPVGCEWVREGPDAVLVNVWTGEVLSVAYGVFW
jgi:Ni/Co efflux regulator RcnB